VHSGGFYPVHSETSFLVDRLCDVLDKIIYIKLWLIGVYNALLEIMRIVNEMADDKVIP
jgi:hypothetical protein